MNIKEQQESIKQEIIITQQNIEKLRFQEKKLKQHIAEIRHNLDQKAKNAQQKQKQMQNNQKKHNQNYLRKQFENAQKQLINYQNELKNYKNKYEIKGKNGLQEIQNEQEQIKEKDMEINELKKKIKQLEKNKRIQQKEIKMFQKRQEEGIKQTRIGEQLRNMKQLLSKASKNLNIKQQNYKAKEEVLNQLKEKYRARCKQLGLNPEIEFRKKLRYNKQQNKYRQKKSIIQIIKIPDQIQVNPQKYKELVLEKNMHQKMFENAKKRHSREINQLKLKLNKLIRQGKQLQQKIKERQQDKIQILNQKKQNFKIKYPISMIPIEKQ